ncbi:hypothetical protein [Filomicrobium sp.]|uniref:hypothetical protein n=1 Tax=Filomicrobium sp. TaxID=2024831 RepID=UPI0025871093|nr:hypothetical protein [Filomicrobium sp.]MCV0371860.1 hypothetical protein [Filomicrobium sp.]
MLRTAAIILASVAVTAIAMWLLNTDTTRWFNNEAPAHGLAMRADPHQAHTDGIEPETLKQLKRFTSHVVALAFQEGKPLPQRSPYDKATTIRLLEEGLLCLDRYGYSALPEEERKFFASTLVDVNEVFDSGVTYEEIRQKGLLKSDKFERFWTIYGELNELRTTKEMHDHCDTIEGPSQYLIAHSYSAKGIPADINYLSCMPLEPLKFRCSYYLKMRDGSGKIKTTQVEQTYQHANDKWSPIAEQSP